MKVFGTRRKCWYFAAGVFGFFFLICSALFYRETETAVWAKEGEGERVLINVQLGYNGYGKFGRYIPIRAELTSPFNVKGIWQVIIPTGNGEENYAYKCPITLEAGKTVSVRTDIPLLSGYTQFYIEFIGEDGLIYGSSEGKINTPASQLTELFVGVLSTDEEVYRAFDGINIGEYTDNGFPYVVTRSFALKIADIQDTIYSITSMDIIVCDAVSYKRLSNRQKIVLENWVKDGGILLKEIGDEDFWLEEDGKTISEPKEVRPVCWMQFQNVQDGRTAYIWIGSDETDLVRYLLENRELSGAILGSTCTSEKIKEIQEKDHLYENIKEYDSIVSMLSGNILEKLPNVGIYLVLIGGYLVLAGPVLRIVLHRIHRMEWMRLFVGLSAIGFSILIYAISSETRIKSPFIQYASIVELEEMQRKENTYLSIQAPSHKIYAVDFDSSYFFKPITKKEGSYYNNVVNNKVLTQYTQAIYDGVNETSIVVKDTAAFRSQYYLAEKSVENNKNSDTGNMQIQAKITRFCDILKGTITNDTGKTLKNPMVLVDNFAVLLPDLKDGESASIEDGKKVYYSLDGYEKQAESMTGISLKRNQQLGNGENQMLLRRTKLLAFYLMTELETEKTDIKVIAFLEEEEPFAVAGKAPSYGVTLITQRCDFSAQWNGLLEEKMGIESITNVDGSMDYDEVHGVSASSSIALEYEIGSVSGVQGLYFSEYLVEEGNTSYKTFDGDVFVYNPVTLKYDVKIDISSGNVTIQELMDYLILDRNGTYSISILYISDPTSMEEEQKIYLPRVSLIKRKM